LGKNGQLNTKENATKVVGVVMGMVVMMMVMIMVDLVWFRWSC